MWSLDYSQLAEFDGALLAKDAEIVELEVTAFPYRPVDAQRPASYDEDAGEVPRGGSYELRGRAPPAEMFSGEKTAASIIGFLI